MTDIGRDSWYERLAERHPWVGLVVGYGSIVGFLVCMAVLGVGWPWAW